MKQLGGVWFLAAVVAGCASAGHAEDEPRVPVFFAEDDVPCAYDAVGRVTGEVYLDRRVEEQAKRVLGEAGARAGADAVLLPDEEVAKTVGLRVQLVGAGTRRSTSEGASAASSAPRRLSIFGWLLVYTEENCGA